MFHTLRLYQKPQHSTCHIYPAFAFPTIVSQIFLSYLLRFSRWREYRGGEPQICSLCGGHRVIPCDVCSGIGKVKKGVFNRNNSLRKDSLVGSPWTAVVPVQGRRHFVCIMKKGKGKDVIAVLQTTCGKKESRISVEVPLKVIINLSTLYSFTVNRYSKIESSGAVVGFPWTTCSRQAKLVSSANSKVL